MKKIALLIVCLSFSFSALAAETGKMRVLLDCDTANEIDDLYAILRAMVEPSFDIVGLTSAQWHTQPKAPKNTVVKSQALNEKMLQLMGRTDLPHPMGANDAMEDPATPRDSPAARFIIKKAHETPAGEKLTVITTGAVTNMASAVLLDPTIKSKIRCFTMGLKYEDGKWKTNEFNAANDLNAVECLFQADGFEWHVMTATASRALVFKKAKAVEELEGKGGVYEYILDYWLNFDPPWKPGSSTNKWVMWDIAAVEAMIHPAYATEKKVSPPKKGKSERQVWVYTQIDAEKMEQDFWQALRASTKK
ncbi:hypothetical protein GF373_09690 [bacterium]|nr:hypothetical protein [bacterium]